LEYDMKMHVSSLLFSETVNIKCYQQLIRQLISLLDVEGQDHWLQQDEETAHTTNLTMDTLPKFFGNCTIS